ncbi:MAG: Na/Pi cotransporter family protein [Lachnospiraceae bacterium]|nr:Na/Pi cotransporter family protein [Lachnospiraceae bacterium]
MGIFDVLTLIGGLCLFLFGMNIMGQSLERRAGTKLRSILGKLTSSRIAGLLTGMGVTAVIQSSSATTVMVVGFVNSGLMTLKQAINVIMGANIGTTVTAWILSLSGIDSGNLFVQMLKPTSFTPILALIGIVLYMFCKDSKKNDTGMILLGFATLMFGMDTMSDAVSGLENVEGFRNLFLLFKNPFLGMAAGAILTAIIQSSSASVGILQALAKTGQVSYGAAIPIIMGQNIGTCVTAMISSVGANKNAKRAALVHLSFNVIGTIVWLTTFCIVDAVFSPALLDDGATQFGIAVAHSIFNVLCTLLLLPMAGLLEKLVTKLVPEDTEPEKTAELDQRLLTTPPIALERSRVVAAEMAELSFELLGDGMGSLDKCTDELVESMRKKEKKTDHYEDVLGAYLVELSTRPISEQSSREAAMLLKVISDFERIADISMELLASAEEISEKQLKFSSSAQKELRVLLDAVKEIGELSIHSFLHTELEAAYKVVTLRRIIDDLKETMRSKHIIRLQQGGCSIGVGFVWSDILTNLERISNHCANVAGCIIEYSSEHAMNIHRLQHKVMKTDQKFIDLIDMYAEKYALED